jgi:hypothetical protein
MDAAKIVTERMNGSFKFFENQPGNWQSRSRQSAQMENRQKGFCS